MRKEKLVASGGAPATWYDQAYSSTAEEYTSHYSNSRYLPVWEAICARVEDGAAVLEVGCGPGQLARMMHDRIALAAYVGFDFSPMAVKLAQENLPEMHFEVGDARTTPLFSSTEYGTVVCTEVLEHIVDDVQVLERIPSGKRILATVPNFDFESHVRHFASSGDVRDRYGSLFKSLPITEHYHAGDLDGSEGIFFLLDGIRR